MVGLLGGIIVGAAVYVFVGPVPETWTFLLTLRLDRLTAHTTQHTMLMMMTMGQHTSTNMPATEDPTMTPIKLAPAIKMAL